MPLDASAVKWDKVNIDPGAVKWDEGATPSDSNPAADMPFYQKAWVGLGSTWPSLMLGAQQIANGTALGGAGIKSANGDNSFTSQFNAPENPSYENDAARSYYQGASDNSTNLSDQADQMKSDLSHLGGWGTAGSVFGKAGLSAPLMAIPGANSAVGSTLIGSLMGALEPTGANDSRIANASMGGIAGLLGYGLPTGIGMGINAAKNKVAQIESSTMAKAAADAASETASARSAAGNAAQNAYRQLEHLRGLNAMGLLTDEQKQIAAQLESELAQKSADKLIPAATQKASTSTAYQDAMATEADRATQLASDKLSGAEAKSQFMARLKRYGPAMAGGAIGHFLIPGLGTAGGAATGLVLRPAIRSGMNFLKNPAVQRNFLLPIANRYGGVLTDEGLPAAGGLIGRSIYASQ